MQTLVPKFAFPFYGHKIVNVTIATGKKSPRLKNRQENDLCLAQGDLSTWGIRFMPGLPLPNMSHPSWPISTHLTPITPLSATWALVSLLLFKTQGRVIEMKCDSFMQMQTITSLWNGIKSGFTILQQLEAFPFRSPCISTEPSCSATSPSLFLSPASMTLHIQ